MDPSLPRIGLAKKRRVRQRWGEIRGNTKKQREEREATKNDNDNGDDDEEEEEEERNPGEKEPKETKSQGIKGRLRRRLGGRRKGGRNSSLKDLRS